MSPTSHEIAAIVLAAGKGKRMRSKTSKVLHRLNGRPLLDHVLTTLEAAGVSRTIIVTGFDEAQVRGHLGDRAECVNQASQLGTGHAVMQATPALENFNGMVLIVCGDTPLWRAETLRDAIARAQEPGISGIVLSMRFNDPTGYGRVVRDAHGEVKRIVEQKDATEEEALIREVNSGAYCFHSRLLFDALKEVTNTNAQGEYYLTDVIEILGRHGHRMLAHIVDDPIEALGVNSRIDLASAEEALQRRLVRHLMESGVTVVDPRSTWIGMDVQVGEDTTIQPNTILSDGTEIGGNCVIGPNTEVVRSTVGEGSVIRHSVIENQKLPPNSVVGPFVHLK